MKINLKHLDSKITEVLKALDRNEVDVFYWGNLKAVMMPKGSAVERKITDHPFFNMDQSAMSVKVKMNQLRNRLSAQK